MSYSGLPCPLCSAPVPLTPQSLGQRHRCPSCGLLCLATRIDGLVSLIPLAASAAPAAEPAPQPRDWSRLLPILVPAACLAIVVIAIGIRAASDALRERSSEATITSVAPPEPSRSRKNKKPAARAAQPATPITPARLDAPQAGDEAPPDQPIVREDALPPLPELPPVPEPPAEAPLRPDLAAATPEAPRAGADLPAERPPPAEPPTEPPARREGGPAFDEVAFFKNLREAKNNFRARTAEALARFTGDCEEIVKRQAKATGDLDLASSLLKEIELLKKDATIPTSPQFAVARSAMIEERKQADRALYDVYKATIDGLVRELQIERAINVRDEMEIFVRKEREFLGLAAGSVDSPIVAAGAIHDKPLLIDLSTEKQIREYDAPEPGSRIYLTIDELVYFPDEAKFRGGLETAPAGKPLVVDFSFTAGPKIEVACVHIPTTKKLQLRVESLFEEAGTREFALTFPRLDKLEAVTRMNIVRLESELQMLARPRYARGLGDPGGELVVAQDQLRSLQFAGPYNEFPREHARKAALTRTANLVNELSKRVQRAQGEAPRLAARLSAVPAVRQFMESIHQRAEIHYTIYAEREGLKKVVAKAGQ